MNATVASELPLAATAPVVLEVGDDMLDSEAELPSHPAVRDAIQFCNDVLTSVYREADARALQHQRWHRCIALLAAVLGTLAVLLSILALPEKLAERIPKLPWLEAATIAIAAVAVAAGLLLAFQSRWQVERNKAERCRLLKFRFLTDPEFWCANPVDQQQRRQLLKSDVDALGALTSRELEQWLRNDPPMRDPALNDCAVDRQTLLALVGYYRAKRIGTQTRFFENRLTQHRGRHRKTWHIASWLFLASVIAAFGHFLLAPINKSLGIILTLLAAGLPAIAAGVRTFRSTHEFARNAMRYEAKLTALRALDHNLAAELAAETADRRRVFHDLWCCELVMEFEHREWLRLMIEAEWY